jgi:hypothetical protein
MIKKPGLMLGLIMSIFAAYIHVDCAYSQTYNLPFSDNANHPAGVYPGTVITTGSHGMWVVTKGSYISTGQRTEVAYFYQDAGNTKMSYTTSGITLTVIAMPDPSPAVSATTNPITMQPGTVLILENGQVWRVTSGSYMALASIRQIVVVYEMSGTNHLSFQTSGTTLGVELLSQAYTLTLTKSGTGSGTVTSSPSGISCGGNCSASYASGAAVSLAARADAGSYFAGWSAPCSGISTCTLTLTADTQVTAAFSPGYFDTVQAVYIGYYQRPADPGGLLYWAERLDATNGNLNEIIEAYANSPESVALYGNIDSSNIGSVVDSIYVALFNRPAEAEGKAFYVNGFNAGRFTAATIMLNVLYGAQNEDLQSINNKLAAANLFTRIIDPEFDGRNFMVTYAGNSDAIAARAFLASVTDDPTTVPTQDEATEYTQTYIADPGDQILR